MGCLDVTNAQFLDAIRTPADLMAGLPTEWVQWVCHFKVGNQWGGEPYNENCPIEFPDQNTFFSISLIKGVDGELKRRKANFGAMLCVVLDDVGTKSDVPTLEPSWKLETSPDNFQWGYILKEPITDPECAKALMDAIVIAGYSDSGAKGPETRYMRLPVGSNCKPEHMENNNGKPVPHVLHHWEPVKWFSLDDIIEGLELNINPIDDTSTTPWYEQSKQKEDDSVLIQQIITGENYHNAIVVLSARYQAKGIGQETITKTIEGFMLSSDDRSPRWKERFNDIPRIVKTAFDKFSDKQENLNVSYVDFTSLIHTAAPSRRWVVDEWLPRGSVSILYGPGGVGKSLLAQQLSIAISTGTKWIGLDAIKGNTIGFFCEDDKDEMLRRAENIFNKIQINALDGSEGLHLDARAGKPNTLMTFGNDRKATPSALIEEIRNQCANIKPVLVILDNIAQMFGGIENDRYHVTTFCNELTALASDYDCSVLLLGHPAKAIGSEYSGSTAWEAAVRARLFLQREEDGTITLSKSKSNYSKLEGITIEYSQGAFIRYTQGDSSERLEEAKPLILNALKIYTGRQTTCSHIASTSNNIVRRMISDGLHDGLSNELLNQALYQLIDEDILIPNSELSWRNSSRHKVYGLALNSAK